MSQKYYINPHAVKLLLKPWHILLWKMGYYDDPSEERVVPEDFKYPRGSFADESDLSFVWLGQSGFLVHFEGYHLLFDPVFSQRASPFPWIGPKRAFPMPISTKNLPMIDAVFISHDHYDHLDRKAVLELLSLDQDLLFCAPRGVGYYLKKWGAKRVYELEWWESQKICSGLQVHCVPAQHFSGRFICGHNKTLWCGFVIEGREHKIYFAGDTGYNCCDFKNIGSQFAPIDLAFIPSGTYLPRAFMGQVHADPEQAIQIHCDIGAKKSVMMHHSTFKVSKDSPNQMAYELYLAAKKLHLKCEDLILPIPGEIYKI